MEFLKHQKKVYMILNTTHFYWKKTWVCHYKLFDVKNGKIYDIRENYNFNKDFTTYNPPFFKKLFYIIKYYLWQKK